MLAESGNLKSLRFLVDHFEQLGEKLKTGKLILSAAYSDNPDLVRYLISKAEKVDLNQALYTACRFGTLQTIKLLISLGANPNYKDKFTCLSKVMAARSDINLLYFRYLYRQGADVSFLEDKGDKTFQEILYERKENFILPLIKFLRFYTDVNIVLPVNKEISKIKDLVAYLSLSPLEADQANRRFVKCLQVKSLVRAL